MFPLCHLLEVRFAPMFIVLALAAAFAAIGVVWPVWQGGMWALAVAMLALFGLGIRDLTQTRRAILRNYPIAAHLRFLLERFRPEIRQYFFEGDKDGAPFPRDKRAIVYQRAKKELDKRPFGTMYDVYQEQYEWLHHSLAPKPLVALQDMRVMVGAGAKAPYSVSLLNISAMSYGALSANAVRSLNKGALLGGFFHDTGEGGVSPYHCEFGGDLVWEVGSGYFGYRADGGGFDPARFADTAADPQIKMVELKLSQGGQAWPWRRSTCGQGHGGNLSDSRRADGARLRVARKPLRLFDTCWPVGVCRKNARFIRRQTCRIQAVHRPPVGIHGDLQGDAGHRNHPGLHCCGRQGRGTGAAPLEFMDHVGMPLRDGLSFVHNALVGVGLRDRIKIGASGKITSALDTAKVMALGADWCNAARGFMFAVGCIQAQACHTGHCPTGVASQDPLRQRAIVVPDKAELVANFHRNTLHALTELVAAAGLAHPAALRPHHFLRRASSDKVISFAEQYELLKPGQLLKDPKSSPRFTQAWHASTSGSFEHA